jgi:hypothetical protein
MKSNYLVNLALAAFILVLFWLTTQDNHQHTDSKTLSTLSASDVSTLSIFKQAKQVSAFEKKGETWFMTVPLQHRANQMRISLLLSLLDLPVQSTMAMTPQTDLVPFGLDEQSPVLQLNNLQFQFGATNLLNEFRYVLHQHTLYLLEDRVAPLLNASSHSFIDNQLLTAEQKLNYLQLPNRDSKGQIIPGFVEIKLKEGHWQSDSHHSPEQLQKLVDSWQYAQALQVIPLSKLSVDSTYAIPLQLGTDSDDITDEYQIFQNDNAFFVIDEKAQLAYQFMKNMHQQLLLKAQ